jgi:hypothetical protein
MGTTNDRKPDAPENDATSNQPESSSEPLAKPSKYPDELPAPATSTHFRHLTPRELKLSESAEHKGSKKQSEERNG